MTAQDRADELTHQTQDMPAAYLTCRAYGHNWGEWTMEAVDTDTVRDTAECDRCGTYTWRDTTLRGRRTGGGTAYPPGYLMQGTGRLSTEDRDVLRASRIHRTLKGD